MGIWVRLWHGRWRLDTGRSKPRIRLNFASKSDALKREAELREERRLYGLKGSFTPAQRGDISNALGRLEHAGLDVPLTECVEFWVKHHKPDAGKVTLRKLFDDWVEDRKKPQHGLSDRYILSIKETLEPFVREHETLPLSDLTTARVTGWIADRKSRKGTPLADDTKAGLFRYLYGLFGFGVGRGNLPSNPLEGAKNWWAGRTPRPRVLSVSQGEKLLKVAYADMAKRKDPNVWVYVVLAMYTGIRREELMRLTVKSLRTGWQLEVEERESKNRDWRSVRLPFNARIMLRDVWAEWEKAAGRDASDPLIGRTNFKRRFRAVAKAAGIVPWPQNCLRHSFATYHYGAFKDVPWLLRLLGHGTDRMTFNHYLRPTREVPDRWFGRMPRPEWREELEKIGRQTGSTRKTMYPEDTP